MGKFYVGRGKQETNRFGNTEYKMNICLEDIPEEAKFRANNGKTYVYIDLTPLRAADDKGNTHTVSGWFKDGAGAPQGGGFQQQAPAQQQWQPAPAAQPQQFNSAPQNEPVPTPPPGFDPNAGGNMDDCPF